MTTSTIAMTDGGLETCLLFGAGIDLPCFAAYPLVRSEDGRAALRHYFTPFLASARERDLEFVLDTPTWRANPDWGRVLGDDLDALAAANRDAVAFVRSLTGPEDRVVVNGVLGPRGDGYVIDHAMTADEAEAYHGWQVRELAAAGVDRVSAVTYCYAAEAIGVVGAAVKAGVPAFVFFTVETDGRLPDGTPLADAIGAVDDATDGAALGFGVNCAHPDHIVRGLDRDPRLARVRALRVNGSRLSHAELDEAEQLDAEPPAELARDVAALRAHLPGVRVLGGCCGTEHAHVAAIAAAWS